MDKKFKIHTITVEDENGVIATIDLNTQTISSESDSIDTGNFWLRTGMLLAALNKMGFTVS